MLDRLTLDQMRILIAVVDTGSFSAAARKLHRVQSAISQSIRTLEQELGIKLFDRAARVPTLTEAGRTVLAEARQLIRGVEELRARAESIANDVESELHLAVEQVFPNDVLMDSLRGLSKAFPTLPVTLFTEGLGAPEQQLRDGLARLAVYSPLAMDPAGVETQFLASIPILPVAAADHPLALERGAITQEDLDRHVQLVLADRAGRVSGQSGGAARSVKAWRFADQHARLQYALAGFGWTYAPIHMIEGHLKAGKLKRLDIQAHDGRHLSMALYVAYPRKRPPGRAGRWLVEEWRRQLALLEDKGAVMQKGEGIPVRLVPANS